MLKAPGYIAWLQRVQLTCDAPLSKFVLKFNLRRYITALPENGALFQVTMPSGVPTKGAALAEVGSVFTADTAGGPALLWYEPVVTYSGPMSFTWAVTDSVAGGLRASTRPTLNLLLLHASV